MKSSRVYNSSKVAAAIGVLAVAGGLTILGLNSTKISQSIDEVPNNGGIQYVQLRPGDIRIKFENNSHDQDDPACRVLSGCSKFRFDYMLAFPMALKNWPLDFDEKDPFKLGCNSFFVNVVSELSEQLVHENISEQVFSMSVVSLDYERLNRVRSAVESNDRTQLSDSDEAYIQNMVSLVLELAKINTNLDDDDFIKEGMKAAFNSCKNPHGLKLFRGAIPSTFAGVTFVPPSTTGEESLSFPDGNNPLYLNMKKTALYNLFYLLGRIFVPGSILRRSPDESIIDALRKGDQKDVAMEKEMFVTALQAMFETIVAFCYLKLTDLCGKHLDRHYGGFAVENRLDIHFLSVAPNLMADAEEMVAARKGLYDEFGTLLPESQELDDSNGNCKRHVDADFVVSERFLNKLKEESAALKNGSPGSADAAGAAGAAGADGGAELPAAISELSTV